MCGIAGFLERNERAAVDTIAGGSDAHRAREMTLDLMCRVIRHRGPDDQGTFIENNIALGMRRLAIIDVAGGRQPISNETNSVTIVFNGEIYNYRELARDLESRGHTYRTHCDTETIVHLYEEHGASCVEHLRGMFAFAIWDKSKRELFIARDRAGKKPLYYTTTKQGTFVFGSEIKSLLAHADVERALDLQALDAYITLGYVPDPLTIFQGIHKLPPGCHLTVRDDVINVKQYWDFDYTTPAAQSDDACNHDAAHYIDELRRLLEESVRVRLVAEVPLGAFLSGGIDSSTVVALMSRIARQENAPRVKTFSIGFHEDSHNELAFARQAARSYDTDHHEFIVTPDICRVVPELVRHFDEPFADQSAIPTYMVSKLAREHVTVALSGDGGDELFAGYTRYVVDANRAGFARLPRGIRRKVMQPLSRRLPHGAPGRNYLNNIALDPLDRYLDSISMFTELGRRNLYSSNFRAEVGESNYVARMFHELAANVKTGDALDRLLYIDSKTYLPGDILTKVDRMSMAVSLETRAPLLDHKLIDFVTRLPSRLKMRGGETKHILKEAVRPFVSAEIIDRRKQGFGVPVESWINRELRDDVRDTLNAQRARGYFDNTHIDLLFAEHERGRRDHSAQLWTLYMLELWQRAYLDESPTANAAVFDSIPDAKTHEDARCLASLTS